MKKLFLLFLILGGTYSVQAQDEQQPDSTILLNNLEIQIEVTAAVNNMYNFHFKEANKEFYWLKYKYPEHPLPYFLLGLSQWWRILPEFQHKEYDDRFLAYMDSAIYYADRMYDRNEHNVEAAFFLSAAYAFKGRLYAERGDWTPAAWNAKNALKYLDESRGRNDLSPEFLFGDALYNYYIEWIKQNYKYLRPILSFFDDGDMEKGINQLIKVSRNAFYTRTEAQYFLMRIWGVEEGKTLKALDLSTYMHHLYPDNPYFQRFYARMLYSTGRYRELDTQCHQILQRIDSGQTGYGPSSGRYAAFYLGQMAERDGQDSVAQHYYKQMLGYSREVDAMDLGYSLYSLIHLGEYAEKEGDERLAKNYYKEAKKRSDRGSSMRKEAKEHLRKL